MKCLRLAAGIRCGANAKPAGSWRSGRGLFSGHQIGQIMFAVILELDMAD